MPIEYARMEFIQRSKGHSAIAASAYRWGAKLYDERTGKIEDYSNKKGVAYSEVILPETADDSLANPQILWNAVESFERRKNSQLARELVLALPFHEDISLDNNLELARRFVYHHFIAHGLAAQVSIHEPHAGSNNIHAHILLTTRRVIGKSFEKHKARDLLPEVRGGRVIKEDKIWKDYWREAQNEYFLEKGLDLEVDPTGIIHQLHLGKDAHHGKGSNERAQENQARKEQATEIVKNDPKTLIEILTSREAVFTETQLFKTVHRYTNSLDEYQKVLNKVLSTRELVELGENDRGHKLFTSKSMIEIEQGLEEGALKLTKAYHHKVEQKLVQSQIKKSGLNKEQAQALCHITKSSGLSVLVGSPGAGKTYVLGQARKIWAKRYNLIGVSLYNKAARNLETETKIKSQSLHSLLWQIRNNKRKLSQKDIILLDEAGLVDGPLMAELVYLCQKAKAKLVLAGDPKQLQPIGPGAPLRTIVERVSFAELSSIRRQTVAWQNQCSRWMAKGKFGKAVQAYAKHGCVHFDTSEESTFNKLAHRYCVLASQDKNIQVYASANKEVVAINQAIRAQLKHNGYLTQKTTFETIEGEKEFAVGDKVEFLENNRRLGVSNCEVGSVVGVERNKLQIKLDGTDSKRIEINANQFNKIDYGYATTTTKSQGQTVHNTLVYIGPFLWDRHFAYVGMTRHKENLDIYASNEHFKDIKALKKSLNKQKIKDSLLDYPLAFGQRRSLFSIEKIRELKDLAINKVKHKFEVSKSKFLAGKNSIFLSQSQDDQNIKVVSHEDVKQQGLKDILSKTIPLAGTKAEKYLHQQGLAGSQRKGFYAMEKGESSYLVATKTFNNEISEACVFELKDKNGVLKAIPVIQSHDKGVSQIKKGAGIGENYIFDNLDDALKSSKILRRANIFVITDTGKLKQTVVKMSKTREVTLVGYSVTLDKYLSHYKRIHIKADMSNKKVNKVEKEADIF